MTSWWRLEGEEGPEPEQERTVGNTKIYADACIEVGKKAGVHVVDVWGLIVAAAGGSSPESLNEYLP